MKTALFLLLSLSVVTTSVQAQINYPSGPYSRADRQRDDKFIDSDALENQAIQKLEQSLRQLKREIQDNNNFGYGTVTGSRGNRGVDLLSIAISMENSADRLRRLVRGERNRRKEPEIRVETTSLNQLAFNLINSIPSLVRSSANLIDNIYNVAKAVGGVELALNAPRSGNGPDPVVVNPPIGNYRAGYCSLEYSNQYGSMFLTSGEGIDESAAAANLYANCGKQGGSAGNVSNAAVCQSRISQSKCLNTYEIARNQDASLNRFSACTLSYTNQYGSAFTTNGAGPNIVEALSALWESCKNQGGSAGNISNAEVCRKAFVEKRFACTVR